MGNDDTNPSPAVRVTDELAAAARALLVKQRSGVLSTISVHRAGYPYGSVTPYTLSPRGQPIVLISTLAAHTKNLLVDSRACLFVGDQEAADDPQAGGRASLLGRFARVPESDLEDARARYVARLPQARQYFQTHDFQLWELAVEELRLIAGFGRIAWLDGGAIRRDPAQDPLHGEAAGICAHMNQDHAEALATYCRAAGRDPTGARMIAVDALGFDVATDGERLRFDFPAEVSNSADVRRAVIALLTQARARLSASD
jgi:putative heme iron utilization protein